MMKLIKILKNYAIKNKLFEVVINNASNNSILKEKLEKIMSCCKCYERIKTDKTDKIEQG